VYTHSARARGHKSHAWCGRVCVPDFLHKEFLRQLGGDVAAAEARLFELFKRTLAAIPDDVPIPETPVKFWRRAFTAAFGPPRRAATKGNGAVTNPVSATTYLSERNARFGS
jgi:hypothetical protein